MKYLFIGGECDGDWVEVEPSANECSPDASTYRRTSLRIDGVEQVVFRYAGIDRCEIIGMLLEGYRNGRREPADT